MKEFIKSIGVDYKLVSDIVVDGVKQDGFFGPKTDAALKAKGFDIGFTDNDVNKLCKPNVAVIEPEFNTQPEDNTLPEVGTDTEYLDNISNDTNALNQ